MPSLAKQTHLALKLIQRCQRNDAYNLALCVSCTYHSYLDSERGLVLKPIKKKRYRLPTHPKGEADAITSRAGVATPCTPFPNLKRCLIAASTNGRWQPLVKICKSFTGCNGHAHPVARTWSRKLTDTRKKYGSDRILRTERCDENPRPQDGDVMLHQPNRPSETASPRKKTRQGENRGPRKMPPSRSMGQTFTQSFATSFQTIN